MAGLLTAACGTAATPQLPDHISWPEYSWSNCGDLGLYVRGEPQSTTAVLIHGDDVVSGMLAGDATEATEDLALPSSTLSVLLVVSNDVPETAPCAGGTDVDLDALTDPSGIATYEATGGTISASVEAHPGQPVNVWLEAEGLTFDVDGRSVAVTWPDFESLEGPVVSFAPGELGA